MNAEVISIGDELTSGQRLDTNSRWLSQKLGELGIAVHYHTTVTDDLPANVQVFCQATERADIVVCTGGLGPTADDLTREALAEASSRPLELDEESLEHIKNLFSRRQRPMPEQNVVQAMFPRGSRVIGNPHGSAPGIDIVVPRCEKGESRIFALPGVPAEMKEMWGTVEHRIGEMLVGTPRQVIRHRRIKCFGVGESDLEQMLPDLIRRGRSPSVGITVSKATITLRITARGDSPEVCYASMESTIETIHDCLGNLVFGQEDDELADVVTRLLGERDSTLATVEWGTGGLLAQWLSETSRSSGFYRGGMIVAGQQDIQRVLHLPEELISQHGMNSRQTVSAMAEAARHQYQTDYALAIGQIIEEAADSKNGNEFHYALATPKQTLVKQSSTASHPDILKPRCAKQALNLLRLNLIHSDSA